MNLAPVRRDARAGFSLVELLITMSVMSVVFTAGIGVLHRTMHEQKRAIKRFDVQRVAERISERFRSDVRYARSYRLTDDGNRSQLRLDDGQGQAIEYAWTAEEIQRSVWTDDTVKSRDTFRLLPGYRFAIEDTPADDVVTLSIWEQRVPASVGHEDRNTPISERPLSHVRSTIGRDWRFTERPTRDVSDDVGQALGDDRRVTRDGFATPNSRWVRR